MQSKHRRGRRTKRGRAGFEALLFEEYLATRHRLMHAGERPWPVFEPLLEEEK